jgi:hypothetical protein
VRSEWKKNKLDHVAFIDMRPLSRECVFNAATLEVQKTGI